MHNPLAERTGQEREDMLMNITRDVALSLYLRFTAAEEEYGEDDLEGDLEDEDLAGMLVTTMLLEAGLAEGYSVEFQERALETSAGKDQIDLMVAKLSLELMGNEGLVETGPTTGFRRS